MARYYHYEGLAARDLVTVPCPLCRGTESAFVVEDNGYSIVRCRTPGCEFVFVNPRPTDAQLAELYAGYYDPTDEIPEKWEREMSAVFRECCDAIAARAATGAVLDVGCSFGHVLQEMERRGWRTVGIEPSPVAAAFAAKHLRGSVHVAPLEDVALAADSFDAVVSLYVLEHVNRPREFLEKVHAVLRPGGLAILRVPYTAPLFPLQRLLGRPPLYAPMHLNDFSPRAFERCARDIGFRRVTAHVGAGRRAHDLVENLGARVLGEIGRALERVSGGRVLFPLVGAFTYHAEK